MSVSGGVSPVWRSFCLARQMRNRVGLGGAVSRTCTAPVDRLKFLMIMAHPDKHTRLTVRQVRPVWQPPARAPASRSPLLLARLGCHGCLHGTGHTISLPFTKIRPSDVRNELDCYMQGMAAMAAEGTWKAYFRGNGAARVAECVCSTHHPLLDHPRTCPVFTELACLRTLWHAPSETAAAPLLLGNG